MTVPGLNAGDLIFRLMATAEDIDIDRCREVTDATEHPQFTAMENKPKKKESLRTPLGEAKWAHVHTPKAPFEGKGSPKFQIDLVFSPDNPEWKAWAMRVQNAMRELPEQIDKNTGETLRKKSPIKRELDPDNNHTGRFYATFKTGEQFPPGVFDKYGNVLPATTLVGNGSKVRVAYNENVYDAFGGGINFYLSAVQVVDLVEYGGRSAEAYGFPVEQWDGPDNPPHTDDDDPFAGQF